METHILLRVNGQKTEKTGPWRPSMAATEAGTSCNLALTAGGIRRPHATADGHTGVGGGVRERLVVI